MQAKYPGYGPQTIRVDVTQLTGTKYDVKTTTNIPKGDRALKLTLHKTGKYFVFCIEEQPSMVLRNWGEVIKHFKESFVIVGFECIVEVIFKFLPYKL